MQAMTDLFAPLSIRVRRLLASHGITTVEQLKARVLAALQQTEAPAKLPVESTDFALRPPLRKTGQSVGTP
jgi:hypothetical protein